MFLGTPKIWWIAAGVLFVGGLALIAIDVGGTLGNVVGIALIFAAMITFAGSPMRYGRPKVKPAHPAEEPVQVVQPAEPAPRPPRPRADIEAKDASEV
jgi:predicted cobalt transporter CbtA